MPEWQDLAVGDPINEWIVRGLEPERALVLHSDIAGSWSWAFILEPVEGGSRTRFIERIRSRPPLPRRMGGCHARDRARHVLMVRKQMLSIRDRAELVQRTAHRGVLMSVGASTTSNERARRD